jgi:hypothetical protein
LVCGDWDEGRKVWFDDMTRERKGEEKGKGEGTGRERERD